ncbi:MAG TPA: FliA/WhiG family RNA polymerase sigma factor [Planctomycetota bacterium]|nr:FliA/WhiG family RNA polymerase sigma factor [Planctomycetota bacterium]
MKRVKAKALAKAKGKTKHKKYVTTALDKRVRRRVASPVSAPLMFRKPEQPLADDAQATPLQIERAQAKAARRHYEDQLWARYFKKRDEDARNALWVHYQPLVRYISERLKTKLPECIDVCDLMGSGNIGLQDAIAKFEPEVGVRFETYCVPRIRGAILDSIRALDWVPRLIRNKSHQYERIVRELAAQLHREPTEEEIAGRLNMSQQEFTDLRKELNVKAQISVEGCAKENADDRDLMRLEMLEHRREVEPTRELQREEIRYIALTGLNTKERAVVEQYYFQGRSMKQIGEELQLSESRICQIHSQVLDVLRKKFRAYHDSCHL